MTQINVERMEYFWAKTTRDGLPGKSILSHMNDVRAVAKSLLKKHQTLASRYHCDIDQLAALAGLHDIGKVAPGFQMKCARWLKDAGLEKEARINRWDAIHESDHSKVTQYALQKYLECFGLDSSSAGYWAVIPAAHHGRLFGPGMLSQKIKRGDAWDKRRTEMIKAFLNGSLPPGFSISDSWPLFWWVAGLISVADWIGSNQDFFPAENETNPEESAEKAANAIGAIGFDNFEIKSNLSFADVFEFSPNDLQQKAADCIKEPGLYVIEAPMGMGKTEAALWSGYQLMQKGLASGIYFALPTQATSNRIHDRINKFASRITSSPTIKTRLIHAGSWLLDEADVPSLRPSIDDEKLCESTRDAIDWFASKKRALLAPFGVGTVDQALMAVIAVKHFFVRHFALAGKVVILDEIHSYDLYTGTLIKTLCDCLLPLDCTILVLSATLTNDRKRQFLQETLSENDDQSYPLISGKKFKIPVKPPDPKTIAVVRKNMLEALIGAFDAAGKGASVLWICDTVNSAQGMFKAAQQQNNASGIEMGLLHARFPVFRREELENYWMEKLGKEGKNRSACILFSTQVVEQSVDLDADLMISELAPTDMLLQRIGRLWRHHRTSRPLTKPELWLITEAHTPDEFKKASSAREIKKMFGPKASVYAPYVLLRSLEIWNNVSSLTLPGEIRCLLERTYCDRPDEPKGWQDWYKDMRGKADALRQFAIFETNPWQPLLADEEGRAKTRISDFSTTQLILGKGQAGKKITLMNGGEVILNNDKFVLSLARAIHKNIVKVPAYLFNEYSAEIKNRPLYKSVHAQVRGPWQFGLMQDDDRVQARNLKPGYRLRYTSDLGIEIVRHQQNQEANDEPCD